VRRLFEATKGHRLHALWVLLATSGLRLGEARGLLWSDIDFAKGRLVVNRALERQTGTGYVFVEPKTARSRRTVYQLAAGPESNNTGLVFTAAVGQPADGSWPSNGSTEPSIKQASHTSGSTIYGIPQPRICFDAACIRRLFRS